MFNLIVGTFLRHRRHPEWGVGVVSHSDEVRIRVDFENCLGKTLVLEYAAPSLEVVDDPSFTRNARSRIDEACDAFERAQSPEGSCRSCAMKLNRSRYNSQRNWKSCPQCSTRIGERHVFYPFPEAFGATPARASDETPDGAQSYCTACRQGVPPHFERRFCGEL